MNLAHPLCQRIAARRSTLISYAIVASALLAAATSPSYGQLTFSQNSYVYVDGPPTQTPASQLITPIPGGQSISFGAVGSGSVSGGVLLGSFDYFSSVLGSGTARYGALGGKIDTDSTSTPDFVPCSCGPNITNFGRAKAHGHLALSFTDSGVLASSTLAVGTPVTLSVTGSLESFGYLVGRPTNADNRARALYTPSVRDVTAIPQTAVNLSMENNGIQTLSFNTVVGHTLEFYGLLDLLVDAQAGRDHDAAPYYSQVLAGLDASNTAHLFMDAPLGVTFVSASGHDYSVTPHIPVTSLVNGATAIPGGTGNFTSFRSPTFPAIAAHPGIAGGDVAFLGAGSAGQQGVYVMSNGPPIKLADVTTAIPDGIGNFSSFFPQLSTHGGEAAVLAAGSGGQQGIYRLSQGPPIKVADLNTAIPEGTGNFTSFPLASPAISSGNVAFVGNGSAGQQGVYRGMIGPPIKLADLNTAIPGGSGNFTSFLIQGPPIAPAISGENVAFIAGGSGGQQGVYRVLLQGPPIKVADTATTIPGSADVFQSFESVSMDRSVVSANLAFVGGGTVGGVPMKGVYVAANGPPIKVADFSTLIPEGTGTFSNFGGVAFDPDAAGNPITAFLGLGSAGQQGIYARFDGTLRKVVDLGDLLDGKTPVSLSLGTSGLDLGQITFAATFGDGSEGLFTSKLPLALAGDYNTDGIVDAADYTVWRDGLGSTYTEADYDVWKAHFGDALGGSGAIGLGGAYPAVPEPATLVMLFAGMLAVCSRRRMTVS